MNEHTYTLEDGRTIRVAVEDDAWSAWLEDDPRSLTIGFPLDGVLMEVLGLQPGYDDVPHEVVRLERRIRADVPRDQWPDESPR